LNKNFFVVPRKTTKPDGNSHKQFYCDLQKIFAGLGVQAGSPERLCQSLPFCRNDITMGSETELQVVVAGSRKDVDLPLSIERSNYFANIIKRAHSGDTSSRLITELEDFLGSHAEEVWENSWVCFPRRSLSHFADLVFHNDLLADKKNPESGFRKDADRFIFQDQGKEETLRVPISYLIKLALADVLGSQKGLPQLIRETGYRLMEHYLNDNTSPESFSFYVVPFDQDGGRGIARETSKRFLLTQLLVQYANENFSLRESGQHAMVYFAPHTPVRQKELNNIISDSFYRELFISPCLSGWNRGEDKHVYMQLCHQVLSRSQLNAVAKLREAGIINNNLVVLPNVSCTSLANNGTHLSLGSRKLSEALKNPGADFKEAHEKFVGDLAIKIVEHFLPLFVGTYSADPYRLGFTDFHPERALGFLAHELDYTHLRMIWRRWRKKASLSVFGQSHTPFGPDWLDQGLSSLFGLKGDFVPDYRLLDYPVCMLSTDRSPALDGRLGNQEKLKSDLADMGIFDQKMSTYLLYKLREFSVMGFSGFEGRHYSLFENLEGDMGQAANLQALITALAFQYMAEGRIDHNQIPDEPSIESERRQIFFGAAIGLPTFYVRRNSPNRFLRRILQRTKRIRPSRRYPGYFRVQNLEYCKALVRILREDAADLISALGLWETLEDLMLRLEHPKEFTTAGKLTRGILEELNVSSPMRVKSRDFNRAAEKYYLDTLKKKHLEEGIDLLERDFRRLDREENGSLKPALRSVLQGQSATWFLQRIRREIVQEKASGPDLRKLITLVLITICRDTHDAETRSKGQRDRNHNASPIYCAQ
jgi:hypothetical protein